MGCPLVHAVDYERLPSVKGLTHLSRLSLGRRSPFSVSHGSCGLCLHLVSQLQEPDQDPVLAIQMPLKYGWIERGKHRRPWPKSTSSNGKRSPPGSRACSLSWLGYFLPRERASRVRRGTIPFRASFTHAQRPRTRSIRIPNSCSPSLEWFFLLFSRY